MGPRRLLIVWLLTTAVLLWPGLVAEAAPALPGEPCKTKAREAWSETEIWVWSRLCVGEIADLNTRDGKVLDPTSSKGWSADRRLSAGFLETILLHDPYRGALPRQGVRIVGALFMEPIDLQEAELAHQLWLAWSRFESAVWLARLQTSHIVVLSGSAVAGTLDMSGADVGGDLAMIGAELAEVGLIGTRIGGYLDLRRATVAGTLDMSSASISGDLLMSKAVSKIGGSPGFFTSPDGMNAGKPASRDRHRGSSAHTGALVNNLSYLIMSDAEFAQVVLIGAKIGGDLNLINATVAGTLNMDNVSIGKHVFTHGGRFDKAIILAFAEIGGNLHLGGAKLVHVDLAQARIGAELSLAASNRLPLWSKDGWLRLRNTRVDAIQDRPGAWPEHVVLGGFTYERLGGSGVDTDPLARGVGWYTHWLKKDAVYARDPYEQLARVLRNMGHAEAAAYVLYTARERERADAWDRGSYARWFGLSLLNWTMGYGYGFRYFRALIPAAALILLGWFVLRWWNQREEPNGARLGFWYSLDRLLPGLALRHRHEEADLTGCARVYFYIHHIIGFVLASFLIAGLAGLTK